MSSLDYGYIKAALFSMFLGSKNIPPRPMTLGERKRNGPRVLVNKLNINHEVIERLRRITKVCGRQLAPDKVNSQGAEMDEINGSKDTEKKNEGEKKSLVKEAKTKESTDKDSVKSKLKHSLELKLLPSVDLSRAKL